MWYQNIPDVSAVVFLSGIVRLFGLVLRAVLSNPILTLFLGLVLLMVVVALFQLLYQATKSGY